MPSINGTLVDRKGNIIPFVLVAAQEVGGSDTGQGYSDKFGQYSITVTESGTEYDLWLDEVTSTDASNYIGRIVSSGDVVSSFTLCADANWKSEHYGSSEAHPCGEHKASLHDSMTLRAGGYVKSTSTSFVFRIGSDTALFNINDIGDTFFFAPKVTGGTNVNIGLSEGPGGVGDITNFFFGTTKARYIDSTGAFNLLGGSFNGVVTHNERVTFAKRATFANTAVEYPRLSSYSVAPANDEDLAPKKYVDDQITANLPPAMDKIVEGNTSVEVVDLGTGQVVITHDGTIAGVSTLGKFGFGGNFVADELVHLKKSGIPVKLKVERTGSGASVVIVDENSIGTLSTTGFYIKSNGTNAILVDTSQRIGVGLFASLTEKLNVNGNIRLGNYINFDSKSVPANPSIEQARLYLKARDSANNELAAKVKKNNAITEVLLTSPEGKCTVCGTEGSARDPYFDIARGKMIISFYCGHKYEIDMNFTPIKE